MATNDRPGHGLVSVYVDGDEVRLHAGDYSGHQIRHEVGADGARLWLDVPDGPDKDVPPEARVVVEQGQRYFTDRQIEIVLDRKTYEVPGWHITDSALRALPTPPIGDNREIWHDVEDAPDDPIMPGESVEIHRGDRFFSAPKRINPGKSE